MRVLAAVLCAGVLGAGMVARGQTVRAEFQQMVVPSHGSMLLGVFYLAAGAGPHPTAVLFHGFPGYEQNLDLAQTMRRHGWNVMAMHYRGSWGVKGEFSFAHAVEDADAQVKFVLRPENAQRYRVDTRRVVVIGHSMGGYMAVSVAAQNPEVAAAVLISAWNIGADYEMRRRPGGPLPTVEDEARSLSSGTDLLPLAGTSGEALAREMHDHGAELNFDRFAGAVAPRPVLLLTADDGLAASDHGLAEALRRAGDRRVTERHWETDHSYSGERVELAEAVLQWTLANLKPR